MVSLYFPLTLLYSLTYSNIYQEWTYNYTIYDIRYKPFQYETTVVYSIHRLKASNDG
jgi:hypothetical protein